MSQETERPNTFTVRVPNELWFFLKVTAAKNQMTMNDIICGLISRYKKKVENA